jgi:hypothetical protein
MIDPVFRLRSVPIRRSFLFYGSGFTQISCLESANSSLPGFFAAWVPCERIRRRFFGFSFSPKSFIKSRFFCTFAAKYSAQLLRAPYVYICNGR